MSPSGVYDHRHMLGQRNPKWNGGSSSHPYYDIYQDMMARCFRVSHPRYMSYGGRGIRVDPTWVADFWKFVSDVGPRPDNKTYPSGRSVWSLDRVDNEGDYGPGNVRWATQSQQSLNRRRTAYSGVLRGSKQKRSKLTEENVLEIVGRVENGETQHRLASEFGVSNATVNNIMRGLLWSWLTGRGKA